VAARATPTPPRISAAAGTPISHTRVLGKFIVTSDSGWQARQQCQYRWDRIPVA
jgi:hypothetical protein